MGEMKEFLQSTEWLRFQEATGREVMPFAEDGFSANGIVHQLPLVGKYLYIPRGPIGKSIQKMVALVALAKERGMKWLRIEPETLEMLEVFKKEVPYKIVRAPHDMQPREIFKIDISPSEEALLSAMKSKTRYNIRLAEKRGVRVFETREEKYQTAFLDLITTTSGRKKITAHSRAYYEKFFSMFPEEVCRLLVAEYEGQALAANLVIFHGETALYLHGGSSDRHRDVMAPYLLQWETIKYAKLQGYRYYDFGGVHSEAPSSSWAGITKFKMGFSPQTTPIVFPGSYDIVLHSKTYFLYDILRKLRALFVMFKKKIS